MLVAVVLHDVNNSGCRPHCVHSKMEIPVLANLPLDIFLQNSSGYGECRVLWAIFSDLKYSDHTDSFVAHRSESCIDFG